MSKLILTIALYSFSLFAWGQDAKFWHWKDLEKDGVHGVSLFKAQQLIKDLKLKPSPVIIAVLDGGIDTAHLQIKPLLWNNPKEIPGNAMDDDKNGYIDDVHGWNFLGNAAGENINKVPPGMQKRNSIFTHGNKPLPKWSLQMRMLLIYLLLKWQGMQLLRWALY